MFFKQLGWPSRSSAERLLFLNFTPGSFLVGSTAWNSPICTAALSTRYNLSSETPATMIHDVTLMPAMY